MDSAGSRQEGSPAFNPVLTEYFAEIAEHTGIEPDDPQLLVLRQAVEANEELFALIDTGSRLPSEDPFDFVRFVRAWSESSGA